MNRYNPITLQGAGEGRSGAVGWGGDVTYASSGAPEASQQSRLTANADCFGRLHFATEEQEQKDKAAQTKSRGTTPGSLAISRFDDSDNSVVTECVLVTGGPWVVGKRSLDRGHHSKASSLNSCTYPRG